MKPFPEEHELIWLFESTPKLADEDAPWFYNDLTFTVSRGQDFVQCRISPAYEELRFLWSRDGIELVNLELHWVNGLEVIKAKDAEFLKAYFREVSGMDPLLIRLKPNVWIYWRTILD
jgi:hypothetical protein